jgi:hypothetical protein
MAQVKPSAAAPHDRALCSPDPSPTGGGSGRDGGTKRVVAEAPDPTTTILQVNDDCREGLGDAGLDAKVDRRSASGMAIDVAGMAARSADGTARSANGMSKSTNGTSKSANVMAMNVTGFLSASSPESGASPDAAQLGPDPFASPQCPPSPQLPADSPPHSPALGSEDAVGNAPMAPFQSAPLPHAAMAPLAHAPPLLSAPPPPPPPPASPSDVGCLMLRRPTSAVAPPAIASASSLTAASLTPAKRPAPVAAAAPVHSPPRATPSKRPRVMLPQLLRCGMPGRF